MQINELRVGPGLGPRRYWIAAALLAIAAWGVLVLLLHFSESIALSDAAQIRRSLARSLAQYQESSMRAIDHSLQNLRDSWLRDPSTFRRAVQRQEELLRDERVIQVAVLDRDGWLAFSKLPQSEPLNFADREYFAAQKSAGRDALHISEPVLGRVTKEWAIQISRPIYDGGNEFAGLLIVAVPVPALELVYGDVSLGKGGAVALIRADGRVLARSGELEKARASSFADLPGLTPDSAPVGDFKGSGSIDGIERMVSYARLRNYPLTVYVGQSIDTVLLPYRRARTMAFAAAALGTALFFGISALFFVRGNERASAARTQASLQAEILERERHLLDERERIMLELHDSCMQSIYAVGLQLEQARAQIAHDPAEAANTIAESQAQLNVVIHDLRRFLTLGGPGAYSPTQFVDELHNAVARMAPPPMAARVHLEQAAAARLSAGQAEHVVRIVKEAVSNAVRHAGGHSVEVGLTLHGESLRLEVADDGAGMPAAGQTAGSGLGLHHIRIRAHKLGGRMTIHSASGGGTRITVEFPAAASSK